ncbi:MAG: glycosyltransferase family 4 protein [Desulfobacula sp.]|nr:glycosyltransferase family 4 protein [Desulfobacula sp.]
MKIIIITPTFFPTLSGNAVCARRIELGLRRLGHEVLVRTPNQIDLKEIKFFSPDVLHGLHAYQCRVAQKLSLQLKIPYILTLTGSDYEECLIDSVKYEKALNKKGVKEITLNAMKDASYLVVYNNETREKILSIFPEFTTKMSIIAKGVPIINHGNYSFRDRNSLDDKDFVFSLVSGIRPRKNNFCPIDSLGQLRGKYKKIVLTFVGPVADEQYDKELREKIKGLDWIRYVGGVSIDNMKSVFLESDVVLNCSHFEGESNAIIEAMYYGRPLLVSEVDGNIPLVEDGVDGLFFEQGNGESFKDKAEILIVDRVYREKLGQNAREKSLKIINNHEPDNYENLYALSMNPG